MQVYVMWVYINVFIKINNLWKILFSKMKKYLTKPITFELFYDWNYLDKQYFFFFLLWMIYKEYRKSTLNVLNIIHVWETLFQVSIALLSD